MIPVPECGGLRCAGGAGAQVCHLCRSIGCATCARGAGVSGDTVWGMRGSQLCHLCQGCGSSGVPPVCGVSGVPPVPGVGQLRCDTCAASAFRGFAGPRPRFEAALGEGCGRENPPDPNLRVRCNFWALPRHAGAQQQHPHGRAAQPCGRAGKGSGIRGCEGVPLRGEGGAVAGGVPGCITARGAGEGISAPTCPKMTKDRKVRCAEFPWAAAVASLQDNKREQQKV